MEIAKIRKEKRNAKHESIRRTCVGTNERPRLCIRRTLKNMIAQVVDDSTGRSVLQMSTSGLPKSGNKSGTAKALGKMVGEKLIGMGIDKVVFDRGGYVYHGRVKAVADGAREGGLKF